MKNPSDKPTCSSATEALNTLEIKPLKVAGEKYHRLVSVFKCFSGEINFNVAFSNSLIIHQAKTKKITTVKEVLIPGLN